MKYLSLLLLSLSVLSNSLSAAEWELVASDVHRADLIKATNGLFHTNNYYSADGLDWQTTILPPHNHWINASGYGDGVFVLTGATGQLWTSTDFTNWIPRHPGGEDIIDVTYGNGVFVARKFWSSSQVWVSSSLGETWQTADTGSIPGGDRSGYNHIAYGNGTFVRPAGSKVHTSSDGTTWNTINPSNIPGGFNFIHRMYYSENAGFFLSSVVSRDGSEVGITTAVSSEGNEWVFKNATISTEISGDIQSSGFAGDLIYLTGHDSETDQTEVWVSDNLGASWTKIETGPWTSPYNDWAFFASNGTILAVGTGSKIYTTSLSNLLDTDGDGLSDYVETNTGVYVSETDTGTDPNNADTDNDGVPDGLEITEGTDPNDTNDFQQFRIIEGSFTWDEAKADAEARGGRLAILNTQEKIDAANAVLDSVSSWPNLWIGLTDEATEGDWAWIDGKELTTDNWSTSGEPNDYGEGEDYAIIRGTGPWTSGMWYDRPQTGQESYLLETLPPDEPLAPIVSLNTFYESNSSESITIDATPSDGYPTNYTYQWYFKAVGRSSYFVIPSNFGGTAANYNISGDSANNGIWKVAVTNDTGTSTAEFNYRVYADSDSDGLSDGQEEFVLGTDPNDNDSDDDTLLDGAETNTGIWVSTSDTGTDPLDPDSDSDGLADSFETPEFQIIEGVYASIDAIKTDALSRGGRLAILDTPEKHEMAVSALSAKWQESGKNSTAAFGLENESGVWLWINGAPLDPSDDRFRSGEGSDSPTTVAMLDAYNQDWIDGQITSSLFLTFYIIETGTNPNNSDTDNDGLLDGTESNSGTYVDSSDTGTNPLQVDSDLDGITDGYETATGSWLSSEDTGTNPTKADSDADGLSDGVETNSGVFIGLSDTGTDPNSQDSDGDGFTDKFEVDTSYDPTSTADTPDAYSFIETAVEVNFYGAFGGTYRIEHAEDLESDSWVTVEDGIEGSSELIERLYSTDEYSRRFFRVVRTDQ